MIVVDESSNNALRCRLLPFRREADSQVEGGYAATELDG